MYVSKDKFDTVIQFERERQRIKVLNKSTRLIFLNVLQQKFKVQIKEPE